MPRVVNKKVEWFRQMCTIRTFEREILALSKAGLIAGTAHLYIGMEAIAVGACAAMDEQDLLTSTHRGHGHCLARGLDPGRMMAEILGRRDGYCGGKGGSMHITDVRKGMLGADGIVGGGIPIATGAALGLRLKASNAVVFCFFGEGAANQGSFHEALNFAAIHHLGVVFICENNLWALSASFNEVTSGQSVASRSAAYEIPGMRVDGNDVEAVYLNVREAAGRARQGQGPSLVECMSYRWEGHSIFTRQEIRTTRDIEEWKRKDPIERWRKNLIESKVSSVSALAQLESGVRAKITQAVEFALMSPAPDRQTAFQNL